jgi:hypothetical protein
MVLDSNKTPFVYPGNWLETVYKQYGASIKGHFDREVKKRGCERLH